MSNVWKTLAAIDCNQHIEKKGQFSYLAWTWAWAMVKENYPESLYTIEDDITYPDGTMEVRVTVTIEGISHTMWLPVLDFKNNAIENPNAFDINSGRMRCLVKCLAMFGLGHYIYAGESAPQPAGLSDEEWEALIKVLAEKDGIALLKLQEELGEAKMTEAFNRPERGKKQAFKDEVREAERSAHKLVKSFVEGFATHIDNNDLGGITELVEELSGDAWLKGRVWRQLTDIQKHNIKAMMEAAA